MSDAFPLHRHSRRRHAATAQFHRWFQLYERPRTAELVERQLQLFADDFEIRTADGRTVATRDGYRDGVAALDPDERHAHHVEHITVSEVDEHRLRLAARVRYARQDASGRVARALIAYEGELIGSVDFEPLFTRLEMTVVGRDEGGVFEDAYPAHRSLSLVHRFLSLVEAPELGGRALGELLAQDGELDLVLGAAAVGSRRELADWLLESSLLLAAGTSRHSVEDFRVIADHDGRYHVRMDVDWNGVTADGAPTAARLPYAWILSDTGERYCRLVYARNAP
ncbi:hypothetical protein ACFYM0_36990 [Streptomyces sp. NPDC006487]|uniref:hypothetical protein n=1 Tax=Streptomyces sp. NPDC006487 TaxID=3364748 RepID=UPI0036D03CB4